MNLFQGKLYVLVSHSFSSLEVRQQGWGIDHEKTTYCAMLADIHGILPLSFQLR